MKLLCPICHAPLERNDRSYRCQTGHSFDLARQGYLHLLPVQNKHSLHPGDTREQVLSRRRFLDAGFYAPIADTLCRKAAELGLTGPIVDIGCGEGYYSTRLAQSTGAELTGLDISKEAVRCAAARYKGPLWICATASSVPLPDHSAQILTSLFALTMPEEFRRLIRDDGYFFQVLAREDHLLGLKSIIYPTLTHKEKDVTPEVPGFHLAESVPIRFTFTVEGQQVQDLLSMTPHVYRISKEGAQRLARTERLTDTASCMLNIFRPV